MRDQQYWLLRLISGSCTFYSEHFERLKNGDFLTLVNAFIHYWSRSCIAQHQYCDNFNNRCQPLVIYNVASRTKEKTHDNPLK